MRNSILRTLATLLSLSLTFASCHHDEEGQAEPLPEADMLQVMAVFCPGQLGDNGLADNVFYGASHLIHFNDTATAVSVAADYISRYDYPSTRQAVEDWLANPTNPINGKVYSRRLLVLTEPFMAGWLGMCKDLLRPTDEVLVLKIIQEDVDAANDTLNLGNRLHAVNISMSEPIKMFCQTIHWYANDQTEDDSIRINLTNFPIFRLYDESLMPRRDSIYETMIEEMGKDIIFSETSFYVKGPDGYPQSVIGGNTLEWKLSYTLQAFQQMWRNGMFFPIIDWGAGSAVLDYFLLENVNQSFLPLLLDTGYSVVNRFYILRPFDKALADWVRRWIHSEVGTMPTAETHGHWDGYSCQTNMWFSDE